jgi:8-oxo-dGTP diphosphatase
MSESSSGILARGPWHPEQVRVRWLEQAYEPPADLDRLADSAVDALRERGSPCHDGLATRLASFAEVDGGLALELQPSRWALRLVDADASESLTALCVVRTDDGRWLAGRRAGWVSTWAGRWALGAGGAVDLGESPAETLPRELREEWQLEAHSLSIEALVRLPNGLAMVVGLARVADASVPVSDDEHEDWAWWDPDPDDWPEHVDDRVRMMGRLLAAGR